jgi:bacteriocin-like protein
MDMNHELNINELDAVSGGLRDIHDQDLICQRQADANKADGTVGGSLTDAGNVFVSTGGTPGQGHGYKG